MKLNTPLLLAVLRVLLQHITITDTLPPVLR